MIFTDIDSTAEYLRKIRKHGKGKDYETLGYNSKMFYMNAAFIDMRFDRINELQSRRIQVASKYHEKLKDLPVITQVANNDLVHNYHKYVVRFKDKETRDKVKNKLNAKIYSDLTSCSNAQKASDTVLFLPCHPYVTENKINQICTKLELIIGIVP